MTSRRLLTPGARALLDAADYIERYGHHKGSFYNDRWMIGMIGIQPPEVRARDAAESKPPACTIGALLAVTKCGDGAVPEAEAMLEMYLGEVISVWNDAKKRTAAEVIATLRDAAMTQPADQRSDT